MIGSFGWMELLLILFIVLIIFGAGKIPQLGEGLGKAIKGFKKSVNEADAMDVTPTPEPPPAGSPSPEQLAAQQPAQPVPPQAGAVPVGAATQPANQESTPQPPPPPAQG